MPSSMKCERLKLALALKASTRLKVVWSLMMRSQMTTTRAKTKMNWEMIKMMMRAVMQVTTTSDDQILIGEGSHMSR
jgi:hypothetical protein